MELRHLRYFVAVAEELSFTRAAERLHIGQPPLSQQIQALEAEIGVTLLDRSRRWVRLTEPGRLFLEDARRILALSSGAAETARRAQRGEAGELRIGFTRSIPYTPIFPAIINAYRKQFPEVSLRLQDMTTKQQAAALKDGALDLGFMRPLDAASPEGLELTVLARDGFAAVLPADHRLVGKASIAIGELRDEDFVMFPYDDGTTLTPRIIALCREAGFEPRLVMEAREAAAIGGLVAAGCGVSVLPAVLGSMGIQGACFRPLKGKGATANLVLARRRGDGSALVKAFLGIAAGASVRKR
ncbi:LysR substrate-binding domain-containing protein [Noviherbaspirillum denitrificans]|uniref:LysR family transcriptional regulator n=1 Tax=Noviherbaspirillum denitrificans TaxID=1968433 RepID=A0A254TH78_9BURK|nr:LysR substrate-binding domain-containing protein [Noviherbaspirillum denitrificans]OWW20662.1 LysR family transcriptional regulator [Noviherbaspirillum denitrificans]